MSYPRFSTVVLAALRFFQFIFMTYARFRQQLLNFSFSSRLILLATLALSACANHSSTRKVWSRPEIVDNQISSSSPLSWILTFDKQGSGLFVISDYSRVRVNRYTLEHGWHIPELIDDMANPSEDTSYGDSKENVRLFYEENGDALAVWDQGHVPIISKKAWTNHYTLRGGWGIAKAFDNSPGDHLPPQIVGDAKGNIFTVWTDNKTGQDNSKIMARVFHPDSGWGETMSIAASQAAVNIALLEADQLGNAYAVWVEDKATQSEKEKSILKLDVWMSRYSPGTGWTKPTHFVKEPLGRITFKIAFDGSGNALLVWIQNVAGSYGIYTKRYQINSGWEEVSRIDTQAKRGDPQGLTVDFDVHGNAIVMWCQNADKVYASRFAVSGGWSSTVMVSNPMNSVVTPQFAFDKNGNALAVWSEYEGPKNVHSIMSARYMADVGWNTPVLVSEENNEKRSNPQIAIDAVGNGVAVWQQSGRLGASIFVNKYDAAKGWSIPKLLLADSTASASRPEVSFDATDIAHVSWNHMPSENSGYRVWSSRLILPQSLNQQANWASKRPKNTASYSGMIHRDSELHSAANAGNLEKIGRLLAEGVDVNIQGFDSSTPLHAAAKNGHKDAVELLIANGAKVNTRSYNGVSPLHEAASSGALGVAEILVAGGANLQAKDGNFDTPLHRAVRQGKIDTAALLISKGAAVNVLNQYGSSPLATAVYENKYDLAVLLLANGAVTNQGGGETTTALSFAVNDGNKAAVELLLKHGANVNLKNSIGKGDTPLHTAIYLNRLEIARLLVSRGSNVNARDDNGVTPLHIANDYEAAVLLIKNGADVNAKDELGYTPLHEAANKGRKEIVQILIKEGGDINARNNENKTPLDLALKYSRTEVIELFTLHGAEKSEEH